ncbi:elongation factor 2-like protein [Tanacetum coccineum]|uniref:Elongation factor 2-like protein n=1 Tax=Tanacetum coccineum TaxID=301880 RepID=A0ABQ5G032_9ASTR
MKHKVTVLQISTKVLETMIMLKASDTTAPLMLYVSKMIPTHVKGEFFAYGHVYSGIVGNDSRVRIMGPNGVPGEEHIKTMQRAVVWMGNKLVIMESVPCGNTIAVFASPFVVVVVDCKDRVKLRKGLKCLVKSHLSVVCTSTKDKTQFFIAVYRREAS